MTRYFGYVRVSTAKQGEGVSLAAQRSAIREYADRHKLRITEWFEEKETAAKRGRRKFTTMLDRLRKREVDGLIVHKIDRSARNLRDWADLAELMDQGVEVHFANESLDLSTRGGRLSADIQAVVAADFIRNIRDETLKGHRERLKQGLYPFAAPLGYRNMGKGKTKAPDSVRAPLIREAFELYDTGEYSLRTLAGEMFERGLRTTGEKKVHKAYIGQILNNPFYAGTIRLSSGDTYEGKHEPIVAPSLFRSVQQRLANKSVKSKAHHDYLYRRLFSCIHCGRYLVAERQKGRVYYRCHAKDCPSRCLREDRIDGKIRTVLGSLSFTDKELLYLRGQLEEGTKNRACGQADQAKKLDRELTLVQTRLTRLTTAYLDGAVDETTYRLAREQYLQKQALLEERRRSASGNSRKAGDPLELAAKALQSFEAGSTFTRRCLLKKVSSNRTWTGKKLSVELQFPFTVMANSSCFQKVSTDQDEVRTQSQLNFIVEILEDWARKEKVK